MTSTRLLPIERLRAAIHYNPWTGLITYRHSGNPCLVKDAAGYIRVRIDRVSHLGHRLAWMYVTGEVAPNDIDHRNLDKADNRWANLRLCDDSHNHANKPLSKANTTGFKGIFRDRNKWRAAIKKDHIRTYLGSFDCPVAAHLAYVVAADRAFGEFARAR